MKKTWTKVRLVDENIRLFSAATADAPVVGELEGKPAAEIAVVDGTDWLEVALEDQRHGFIPGTGRCVQLAVLSTAQDTTAVHTEARGTSSLIVNVPFGTPLEQFGEAVTLDGVSWFPVRTSSGQTGFIDGHGKVVVHGTQVRIQETPEETGCRYLLKGTVLTPIESWKAEEFVRCTPKFPWYRRPRYFFGVPVVGVVVGIALIVLGNQYTYSTPFNPLGMLLVFASVFAFLVWGYKLRDFLREDQERVYLATLKAKEEFVSLTGANQHGRLPPITASQAPAVVREPVPVSASLATSTESSPTGKYSVPLLAGPAQISFLVGPPATALGVSLFLSKITGERGDVLIGSALAIAGIAMTIYAIKQIARSSPQCPSCGSKACTISQSPIHDKGFLTGGENWRVLHCTTCRAVSKIPPSLFGFPFVWMLMVCGNIFVGALFLLTGKEEHTVNPVGVITLIGFYLAAVVSVVKRSEAPIPVTATAPPSTPQAH